MFLQVGYPSSAVTQQKVQDSKGEAYTNTTTVTVWLACEMDE